MSSSLGVGTRRNSGPWSFDFFGCTLSGNYDGAPLVVSGSCPSATGTLNLSGRGITQVAADAFLDMSGLT